MELSLMEFVGGAGALMEVRDCFESVNKLQDLKRFEAYKSAVSKHFDIKDKVVVDVDCGTGILSIFCAQAGAKRVYAVEASEIVSKAREIVEAAGLSEIITVLHGDVKDVSIKEPVDVIISDWMGHLLCYKSMLGRVLTARDRWLKAGGLVIPSQATLYMAPVALTDGYRKRVNCWTDVFGIDMSAVIPLVKARTCDKAFLEEIKAEDLIALPQVVKHVDCYTINAEELKSISSEFKFSFLPRDEEDFDLNVVPPPPATAMFHGFAFWTDVKFSGPNATAEAIILSSSPENLHTQYEQTLLYLNNPIDIVQDDQIVGDVRITPNVTIIIKYKLGGNTFVKNAVLG